jgi:hypothetical protein
MSAAEPARPFAFLLLHEHARDGADEQEHGDHRRLVGVLHGLVVPREEDVRRVGRGCGSGDEEAALPAEPERGRDDGKEVQAPEHDVNDVLAVGPYAHGPVDGRDGGERQGEDGEFRRPAGREATLCVLLAGHAWVYSLMRAARRSSLPYMAGTWRCKPAGA